MMTVITGGSGSGKSAYAESYLVALAGEREKYYLATMQVFDKEGQAKVERHRKLRSGKGFVTIEQPVSIQEAMTKRNLSGQAALLECMSNLTANEMFCERKPLCAEAVADKIIKGIEVLNETLGQLVIVTNNVFEDGIAYDASTMEYLRALGSINERLAVMADSVIEVVVGIPVWVKKETEGDCE